MSPDPADRLVEVYFATGTLSGLPDGHFIDGRWRQSMSGRRMEIFDAGLARPFHQVAAGDADDIDMAAEAASRALKGPWRDATPAARGEALSRVAKLIRQNAPRLAVVESLDVGKPLQEAEGDVAGAARSFEYYAGAADKLLIEKMDVDANQDVPAKFGIRGIPTLILFKNGVAAAQKVGAMAKGQLTAFIDSNI